MVHVSCCNSSNFPLELHQKQGADDGYFSSCVPVHDVSHGVCRISLCGVCVALPVDLLLERVVAVL